MGVWKVAPRPKEPTTIDQQLEAFAIKFPSLGKPAPTPMINIPSVPQHTHVSYESPMDLARRLGENLILAQGTTPNVEIGFKDSGDFPVQEPSDSGVVLLIPSAEIKTAFAKARKSLKFLPGSGTLVSKDDPGSYHTFLGPSLTKDDIEKLTLGTLSLCGFGAVRWKDATGRYETDFAQCATTEPSNRGAANWHNSKENNEEHKLN